MAATTSEQMGITSECEFCNFTVTTYRRAVRFTETDLGAYVQTCNACLAEGMAYGVIERVTIDNPIQQDVSGLVCGVPVATFVAALRPPAHFYSPVALRLEPFPPE